MRRVHVLDEFFIPEERRLAAPAPATFNDHEPVIAIYTDEYLNKLCEPERGGNVRLAAAGCVGVA